MKKCEECKRNIRSHKFSEMNIGGRGYTINLNKLLKDNITDEAKGKVLFQRGIVLRVKCCTDIKYSSRF